MDAGQPTPLERLWGWADHQQQHALDTAARKRFMALCGLREIEWGVLDHANPSLSFEQFSTTVQALPPTQRTAVLHAADAGTLPKEEETQCLAARRLLFKFLRPQQHSGIASATLDALLRHLPGWNHGSFPKDVPEMLTFSQFNSIVALLPWRPALDADALDSLSLLWQHAHGDQPTVSSAEYTAFLARFDIKTAVTDDRPRSVEDFRSAVQRLPDVCKRIFLSLGALLASRSAPPSDASADVDGTPTRYDSSPTKGDPSGDSDPTPSLEDDRLLAPVDAEVGLRVLFDFLDPDCRGYVPVADLTRLGIQTNSSTSPAAHGLAAWPQLQAVLDGHHGLRGDEAQSLKGLWALWQWYGLGAAGTSAEELQRFLSRLGLHPAPPTTVLQDSGGSAFFGVWQWLRSLPARQTGDVFAACAVLAHLQAAAVAVTPHV